MKKRYLKENIIINNITFTLITDLQEKNTIDIKNIKCLTLDACYNNYSTSKYYIYNYYKNKLYDYYTLYGIYSYNCMYINLNGILKYNNNNYYFRITPSKKILIKL